MQTRGTITGMWVKLSCSRWRRRNCSLNRANGRAKGGRNGAVKEVSYLKVKRAAAIILVLEPAKTAFEGKANAQ